jgi:hypothetical protein
MIGTVEFALQGKPLVATLEDTGRWTCPDMLVAIYLNAWHAPEDRPARGFFGGAELEEAAHVLGGTAHFQEVDDQLPEGTVY